MLIVETIGRIRREHLVKGKSIKEIARELNISRNTVRKVLRSGETSFSYEREVQPRPKLGRWKAEIDRLLTNNVESAARERLTLIRVFEELRALGYEGGYDAVRRYARNWSRAHAGQTATAYVPLSFAPGEAYQFDSHEHRGVKTNRRLLNCFRHPWPEPNCMTRPVIQHRFKLTYGRRNRRLHQYPACVAVMAQENETILELGIDCQIELRFVHPDPARIKRYPGRLQDQLCSTLQAAFITAPS